MTTITLAAASFDRAVALWAAAAGACGGIYPGAAAAAALKAKPTAYGLAVPIPAEYILAAGRRAADAEDARHIGGPGCARPEPLTLRYGGRRSTVHVEPVAGRYLWSVVIDGPAGSSVVRRLAAALEAAEALGLRVGDGYGDLHVSLDGGPAAPGPAEVAALVARLLAADAAAARGPLTASIGEVLALDDEEGEDPTVAALVAHLGRTPDEGEQIPLSTWGEAVDVDGLLWVLRACWGRGGREVVIESACLAAERGMAGEVRQWAVRELVDAARGAAAGSPDWELIRRAVRSCGASAAANRIAVALDASPCVDEEPEPERALWRADLLRLAAGSDAR